MPSNERAPSIRSTRFETSNTVKILQGRPLGSYTPSRAITFMTGPRQIFFLRLCIICGVKNPGSDNHVRPQAALDQRTA